MAGGTEELIVVAPEDLTDPGALRSLLDRVSAALRLGRVVIECSSVRKANSALVATLLIVARRAREAASGCEIRGLQAIVVDLIEIHRVRRLLEKSGVQFA